MFWEFIWNLITFGHLQKKIWQAWQNCFPRARRNILIKTIFWKTWKLPYKNRNMAKTILQLCQKCILLARIIYLRKMFLIEKPKFLHNKSKLCVKLFRLSPWNFQQVGQKLPFLYGEKRSDGKIFWMEDLFEKTFKFPPNTFGLVCQKVFYVSKCIERVITIALHVSRETFWGKAFFQNIFEIWVLLDFRWITFGKFFKIPFYLCREVVWVK